jgi:hypothetical protein
VSAPNTHDPLVVNTQDGCCWTRRAVTRAGRGLYALESVKGDVPELVLATLAELAEHGLTSMADVLPMPAGNQPQGYPPAMPWAALMDHEDLTDFLDELAASAITHASSEVALVEVEKTCATWRLIAEAQHGHNTAPGPDAMTRTFAPTQVLREDPHDSPLHHTYRVGRDLPELGGQR